MKKQIGLLVLSTILIACVAFSGVAVASAQASNIQVLFFYSPLCGICEQVKPLMESAAAQTGVKLIEYDVSTSPGSGIAQANGVTETPTIVIQGGQTLAGSVTEQQIIAAIQAAEGSSTPKIVQATPTPVATPAVVKATPTPVATPAVVKATPVPVATPKAVAKVVTTPKVVTAAKPTTQPSIQVVTATQTPTTSTQTVPEFSLLGLGAPAIVVGAIYLFLRRR
ncbi:MAG: thioredoxin domain-containing protein [Halobacteriota archaeon]